MAKFVSFVSGGLAGALIIIGFVGESVLEGHVSPIFSIVSLAKLQIPAISHLKMQIPPWSLLLELIRWT